jgi:hypothetical protein
MHIPGIHICTIARHMGRPGGPAALGPGSQPQKIIVRTRPQALGILISYMPGGQVVRYIIISYLLYIISKKDICNILGARELGPIPSNGVWERWGDLAKPSTYVKFFTEIIGVLVPGKFYRHVLHR